MEKQKKFLLVLPLLVLPFLTMAFWALGGGKARNDRAITAKGLNTELPQAQFKQNEQQNSKLSVYRSSLKDSANDGISSDFLRSVGSAKDKMSAVDSIPAADREAARIQAKLTTLTKRLNEPGQVQQREFVNDPEAGQTKQIHRMMRRLNDDNRPDPEMRQLSQMLDKIQAIQNPEAGVKKPITVEKAKPFRAISAVVDGKQKVAEGAVVKLKLTDTATIKNQLLQKGQEIFGSCQIVNQRLLLNIDNIRRGKQIIPVSLTVFSLDGMPGIPAPEAELAGSATKGADNTLQSMQLLSMDQSWSAQAAAGGVNAVRELFSKKLRKIRVKLKDNFPILLRINR